MNRILADVLNFLPTESVIVTDLKRGDIASVHRCWGIVLHFCNHEDHYNNGSNIEVSILAGGCRSSWHKPNSEIKVIKRDLIDTIGMQKYLEDYFEDCRKWEKIDAQEKEEEYQREVAYLKERLKHLEND